MPSDLIDRCDSSMASDPQQKNIDEVPELSSMAAEATIETKSFPQFDMVTDYSDHKFADRELSLTAGSSVHKEIMKEWRILKENLPDSIYVRVYEERIDLLRAAIIGAWGTPYYDCIFLFDFQFRDGYPREPPKVRYWPNNFQLNPILRLGGHMCLSLLDGSSDWVPGKSTVFQVLLSLQALVLRENSYSKFTRPGFGVIEDEDVFVGSCQSLVFWLQNPPKNFEEFVICHAHDRSRFILTALQAYMNGFERVGYYQNHGSFSKEQVPISRLFKSRMERTYELLVAAFCKIDPSLKEYVVALDFMVLEYIEKSKRDKTGMKKVFKIFKKIVRQFKFSKIKRRKKIEYSVL